MKVAKSVTAYVAGTGAKLASAYAGEGTLRTISVPIDETTSAGTHDLFVFTNVAPYYGTLVQTISGVVVPSGSGTYTASAAATNQSLATGTYPVLAVKTSQSYDGTANPFYSGVGFATVADV